MRRCRTVVIRSLLREIRHESRRVRTVRFVREYRLYSPRQKRTRHRNAVILRIVLGITKQQHNAFPRPTTGTMAELAVLKGS